MAHVDALIYGENHSNELSNIIESMDQSFVQIAWKIFIGLSKLKLWLVKKNELGT